MLDGMKRILIEIRGMLKITDDNQFLVFPPVPKKGMVRLLKKGTL